MDVQKILIDKSIKGIGIITLNRPNKKNAINIRMRKEITECLNNLKEDPEIGVVIFTGSDSIFSAGFDLDEFNKPEVFDELLKSSSIYHRAIWNFPKPTIAAINGPALGGGFDLSTLCDIRICNEHAKFGHPEVKFGAPPLITPLRWIVGEGNARYLCLSGFIINSREAYRIGLVNEIVHQSFLLERAIEIGQTILEAPMDTLIYSKKFYIEHLGKNFEESFTIEHDKAFKELILPKALEGFKKS